MVGVGEGCDGSRDALVFLITFIFTLKIIRRNYDIITSIIIA